MVRSVILQLSPLSGNKKKTLLHFLTLAIFQTFPTLGGCQCRNSRLRLRVQLRTCARQANMVYSKTDKQLFHRLQHFSHSEKLKRVSMSVNILPANIRNESWTSTDGHEGRKVEGRKMCEQTMCCVTHERAAAHDIPTNTMDFCFSGLLGAIFSLSRLLHD